MRISSPQAGAARRARWGRFGTTCANSRPRLWLSQLAAPRRGSVGEILDTSAGNSAALEYSATGNTTVLSSPNEDSDCLIAQARIARPFPDGAGVIGVRNNKLGLADATMTKIPSYTPE